MAKGFVGLSADQRNFRRNLERIEKDAFEFLRETLAAQLPARPLSVRSLLLQAQTDGGEVSVVEGEGLGVDTPNSIWNYRNASA